MKVPAGLKVYNGTHRYKSGDELPARMGKKLEDRIKEKGEKVQKKKTETEARLKKAKSKKPDSVVSVINNKGIDSK